MVRHVISLILALSCTVILPLTVFADGTGVILTSPIVQKALAQLPPVWDKRLSANDTGDPCNSSRFTCVLGGQGVRDNETGLVWEKSPDAGNYRPWTSALNSCANRVTGGRMGWRLPSVPELSSLIDPAIGNPGPRLPSGHPFLNVQPNTYWTATSRPADSTVAWGVNFLEGTVALDGQASSHLAWCVRSAGVLESY